MVRTAIFGLGNVAERIHLPACQMIDNIQVIAVPEPGSLALLAVASALVGMRRRRSA